MGVSVKKGSVTENPNLTDANTEARPGSELILTDKRLVNLAAKILKAGLYGPDNYRAAVISHFVCSGDRLLETHALKYAGEILQGYGEGNVSDELAEEAISVLFKPGHIPFPRPAHPRFTFIDLFAGIGGFRIALQNLGGECVFTSEWDKDSQKTYSANFGEIPFGDITKEETKKWIPEKFDLLCGGFPCQPFSIAGVVKKASLGRKHGFDDEKQGNLFFHIIEIIEKHRPKAFFLENVKNLISHDKGNTFRIIKEALTTLGYSFYHKVLDGKHFVPQHRQRTFMIGFDSKVFEYKEDFTFPEMPEIRQRNLPDIIKAEVDAKYTLSDKLWNYLKDYAQKHKDKGNGFGYGLINPYSNEAYTRTISARYYKDGAEILVPQDGRNPRRLTPAECARLQGYPDEFVIDAVSDVQSYRQFGNSVVVPLIEAIGRKITETLYTAK